MALKKMAKDDITSVASTLKTEFKKDIKATLADMKEFLSSTNLSEEEKVKRYAEFSANLTASMISQVGQLAVDVVVQDAQLNEQVKVNTAQINASIEQTNLAKEEVKVAKKKEVLAQSEIDQAAEVLRTEKIKQFIMGIESQVKVTHIVAQTLTEARKNGATVTKDIKSVTLPTTGQQLSFGHLSFVAANAIDKTKGEIGIRMGLWEKQTKTFGDHSKIQFSSQLMNLAGIALDSEATNIGGLMNTIKTIGQDVTGIAFDSTLTALAPS